MWFGVKRKNELEKIIESAVEKVLKSAYGEVNDTIKDLRSVTDLTRKVRDLQKQVVTVEIEKSKQEEAFERKERDIEHKIGLVKMEQEAELKHKIKEAELGIQEKNLTAERKQFDDNMKFQNDRFTDEVKYMKDLLVKIMDRLPTATQHTEITDKKTSRR